MGYRQSGIVPVAKHFPGYGNITSDPHKTSAAIDVTEGELNRMLIPFKKIATGGSVHAIMTAHTVIPIVDSKPATLSKKFLTELLRKNFKFDGVIMTDDLEMVSAGRATESIAVDAIAAGADMLISTYTPSKHIKIFEALKEAVLAGTIPEDQLNASVFRILKLKAGLGK
jgi:beta-N-acetylhexosaminidase